MTSRSSTDWKRPSWPCPGEPESVGSEWRGNRAVWGAQITLLSEEAVFSAEAFRLSASLKDEMDET